MCHERNNFGPKYPANRSPPEVERVHELAVAQAAAVGHEIDFREARGRHVPAIGPERDVMFEQRARLGPATKLRELSPAG